MNWYKIFRYPFNRYGLIDYYLKVKHSFQRVFRGYDDRAYWGLDSYVTNIALPVLKWYKKNKRGVPWIEGITTFEEQVKAWNTILDQMIEGFQIMKDEESGNNVYPDTPEAEKVSKALQLFAKHYHGLWD